MKKKLSKAYYKFLLEELNSQKDRGIITKQQLDDMMTFYEEEENINFIILVLMTIKRNFKMVYKKIKFLL